MENIYDVVAWGKVSARGREFYLLAPKPYHSEMADGKVGHSIWQPENTLKWEVADLDSTTRMYNGKDENGDSYYDQVYGRSIIIFSSDALIEFYQDPQTIKVKYITPDGDDDVVGSPI